MFEATQYGVGREKGYRDIPSKLLAGLAEMSECWVDRRKLSDEAALLWIQIGFNKRLELMAMAKEECNRLKDLVRGILKEKLAQFTELEKQYAPIFVA